MREDRETEKGPLPGYRQMSGPDLQTPGWALACSSFKGRDTPVRVELMLRAVERSLPGSPPFYTSSWAPPYNQTSVSVPHCWLGVSPDPQVVYLSVCASLASPTLY